MSITSAPPAQRAAEHLPAFDLYDQSPVDFDAADFPIIARHWFGIAPPSSRVANEEVGV